MTEAAAGAPSPAADWHPDPYGRGHYRYWDGASWTDRVATWGQEWTDPPGTELGQFDASLLAQPSLAFAYGTTGIEGAGTWTIWDPTGRFWGEVVVEVGGGFSPRRRYLFLNPSRQPVLVVDPIEGFLAADANVIDWAGRPHGLFDCQAFSNQVQFASGGLVHGRARAADQAQGFDFGAVIVDHYTVALEDAQGRPYGHLVNHESRKGLASWFGGDPKVGELLPEQSYFELHRPPDLPEPLRSFTLGFPAMFAHRVHVARAAARQRQHRRNRQRFD
jgi:hypothetical protein